MIVETPSAGGSGILSKVLKAAPECIRHGMLLKAVDWQAVSPGAVADMLGRITAAGLTPPHWLAEALLLAGHGLGETAPGGLPPVQRALAAVNALDTTDSAALAGLRAILSTLIIDDASQGAALNALLRRLSEKGLSGLAAPLAVRAWPYASQGAAGLRTAIREEIASYSQLALRLLCLSNADVLAGDLGHAFAPAGLGRLRRDKGLRAGLVRADAAG